MNRPTIHHTAVATNQATPQRSGLGIRLNQSFMEGG